MLCPKCEFQLQDGDNFCPNCGVRVTPKEKTSLFSRVSMVIGLIGLFFVGLTLFLWYIKIPERSMHLFEPILIFGPLVLGPVAFIFGIIELIRISIKKPPKSSYLFAGLAVLLGIFTLFTWFLLPIFMPQRGVRSQVSRAKGEQNQLATALENYFVDYRCYPSPGRPSFHKPGTYLGDGSFAEDGGIIPICLTTPVAYITYLPIDPFKYTTRGYYGYGGGPGKDNGAGRPIIDDPKIDSSGIQPKEGWIITSYGPDMVDGNLSMQGGQMLREELCWSDSYSRGAPDYMQCDSTHHLSASGLTYDPTNGTVSPGDVWRRGP
jgi:hypothetical protein